MAILIKLHDDSSKIVDFLFKVKFWPTSFLINQSLLISPHIFKDHQIVKLEKFNQHANIKVRIKSKLVYQKTNILLISEDCCQSFKIETIGGGNFYQQDRLGNFFKIGNSEDGRSVYRQQNGDNYLFYLQDQGVRIFYILKKLFLLFLSRIFV